MGEPVDLQAFPRVALADLPTPLQRLPRLSEELGTEVWAKRDDVGSLGLAGNKLRKLEFLLGAALDEGCDTIVTFGALQSNHARQTAAACARLGLHCQLVLTRSVARHDEQYRSGGNVLLDHLFGATVHVCDDDDAALAGTIADVEADLRASGSTARWIPPGGSEPVGVLGYVAAAHELAGQCADEGIVPSSVVVASSTGGTQAGLMCGVRTDPTGSSGGAEVLGVAVYAPADTTAESVVLLDAGVSELLGVPPASDGAAQVVGDQLGEGYGVPTAAMRESVALFGRTEGIALDPVYSGKAAAALVAGCRSGRLGAAGPVVFVHTGGVPALFVYGHDAAR